MNNKYLYLRESSYHEHTDDLIQYFAQEYVYIDYGMQNMSLGRLMLRLKENDEVIVRSFADLGTSSYEMLENLIFLHEMKVLITSVDEEINTEESLSWNSSIALLILIFHKIIAFLSSERLFQKRKLIVPSERIKKNAEFDGEQLNIKQQDNGYSHHSILNCSDEQYEEL